MGMDETAPLEEELTMLAMVRVMRTPRPGPAHEKRGPSSRSDSSDAIGGTSLAGIGPVSG